MRFFRFLPDFRYFARGKIPEIIWKPGGHFNIKMLSYQYRVKDKTVSQPSYLYHGNPHTWERRSLYWDGALVFIDEPLLFCGCWCDFKKFWSWLLSWLKNSQHTAYFDDDVSTIFGKLKYSTRESRGQIIGKKMNITKWYCLFWTWGELKQVALMKISLFQIFDCLKLFLFLLRKSCISERYWILYLSCVSWYCSSVCLKYCYCFIFQTITWNLVLNDWSLVGLLIFSSVFIDDEACCMQSSSNNLH